MRRMCSHSHRECCQCTTCYTTCSYSCIAAYILAVAARRMAVTRVGRSEQVKWWTSQKLPAQDGASRARHSTTTPQIMLVLYTSAYYFVHQTNFFRGFHYCPSGIITSGFSLHQRPAAIDVSPTGGYKQALTFAPHPVLSLLQSQV